ncbi:MAG: nucleotidyltransferase domain-containing protein [Micromonosporaceae bacterium]
MNLSEPLADVSPSLHGRVLSVLTAADKPLTGRQVAARVSGTPRKSGDFHAPPGRSVSGTLRVLNLLVDSGLVDRVDHPPSALFTLNRDHLAARHIVALTGLREELFDRLRELIAGWEILPVSAVVFGSVARGDSGPDSDVDLLFVRDIDHFHPTWSHQQLDLERHVFRWTGNRVGAVEFDRPGWERSVARGDPLVDEIARDGVILVGSAPVSVPSAHR